MRESSFALLLAAAVVCAGCGSSAPPVSPGPPEPAQAPPDDREADASAGAPLAPADVVGSWTVDRGDFEEVTIEADGSWSSYLHARPLYSGTWTLAGRRLVLATGDVDEPLVLEVATVDGDALTGTLLGGATRWARIPDSGQGTD